MSDIDTTIQRLIEMGWPIEVDGDRVRLLPFGADAERGADDKRVDITGSGTEGLESDNTAGRSRFRVSVLSGDKYSVEVEAESAAAAEALVEDEMDCDYEGFLARAEFTETDTWIDAVALAPSANSGADDE